MIALVAIVLLVGTYLTRKPQVDVSDDAPLGDIYKHAILALDVYTLSDEELKSKYQDQLAHMATMPGSDIRYMLLVNDLEKTQQLSLRGTDSFRNFIVDVSYTKEADPELGIYYHGGFKSAADEIFADVQPHLRKQLPITIAGHSLGGGVAAVLMKQLENRGYQVERSFTFGQPKVTNEEGARQYQPESLIRVTNLGDFVARIPPGSIVGNVNYPYRHFGRELLLKKGNQYEFRETVYDAESESESAMKEASAERTRGLWDDYFGSHRMVNYIHRLENVIDNGERVFQTEPTREKPDATSPIQNPIRRAVLVGCNEYKNAEIPSLAGCVNDVHEMKRLLVGRYGFRSDAVTVLTDQHATRDAVFNTLVHTLNQSGEGDTVVFYFAGRGSQQIFEAGNGSEKTLDSIVLHDGRSNAKNDLTVISLTNLFALSKPLHGVLILDCCHKRPSGNTSSNRVLKPIRTPHLASMKPSPTDLVVLTADESGSHALESNIAGVIGGVFTTALVDEATRSSADDSYKSIIGRIRENISSRFRQQSPSVQSNATDSILFGFDPAIMDGNDSITGVAISKHLDGTPILHAGAAQGMTSGSVFDVFSPPSHENQGMNRKLAQLRLTRVNAFTSTAEMIEGDSFPYGAIAVETSHAFLGFKLIVSIDQGMAVEESLSQWIGKQPHARIANENEQFHLKISETEKGFSVWSQPFGISQQVPDLESLESSLLNWAKWFNLLFLDNPSAGTPISLRVGDGGNKFKSGERLELSIKNNSDDKWYVAILNLESSGAVSVIHPSRPGRFVSVPPRQSKSVSGTWSVPEGKTQVRDHLKLLATLEPINVHVLELKPSEATRSTNPLEAMLHDAAFGLRDSPADVKTDAWSTITRPFTIRAAE